MRNVVIALGISMMALACVETADSSQMSEYTEVPVVAYRTQTSSEVATSWLTPGSVAIDVANQQAPDRLRVSIGTGSYHIRLDDAASRQGSIDWDERFRLGSLEAERVRLEVLTQGS